MKAKITALALALPVVATAAVIDSGPQLLEVRETAAIAAPADRVWATLVLPARWWSKEHSFSGDAANLSLTPVAGGCFCEKLPGGGGVEHLRVVYVQPGKMLRMTGALGPLQGAPVAGVMTVALTPQGAGTRLALSYRVAGPVDGGADKLAPVVDMVLAQQVAGLKATAERPGAPG